MTKKVIPAKTQAAIAREMSALTRNGVIRSINKARETSRNEGFLLANVPSSRFALTWLKCYLDSCATYHSFFLEEFLNGVCTGKSTKNGSCTTGTVSTSINGVVWRY